MTRFGFSALQDGSAAGQSVPHVHIHILPRRTTDFEGRNDDVYPALEKNEHQLDEAFAIVEKKAHGERKVMTIPKDEDRKVRTEEDMEKEAQWLATFFKDD
jgi:bis(5'-adenosyl)-triphosphatase